MARSREARARRNQRRVKYADEVLGRISDRTQVRVKGMAWDNDLATLLPNHLTVEEREYFRTHIAGMTAIELQVRMERTVEEWMIWCELDVRDDDGEPVKFVPTDKPMWSLMKANARNEHMPEAGKIVQPQAGLKGRVTRYDTSIAPSWEPTTVR